MLSLIKNMNITIFVLFTVIYFYQLVYVFVALYFRKKEKADDSAVKLHRYAAVIAARNEDAVIGELIKSIKKQNYPSKLVDVFVVADNCTDNTAAVASAAGAIVVKRHNRHLVGKGYALDFIFRIIRESYSDKNYEGYFVFDADNLLDKNYITEMNKMFDKGYRILTSYRNSKNYATNWISAGYSLWFLREAEYLNYPRMLLKTSCTISGTGFLVHSDIVRKNGGWKHHLLTEDIEFSIDNVSQGETIGYCKKAIFYDEQPYTLAQSWHQRLRWSKGFYQVFGKYGAKLTKNILQGKNSFSNFDMLMTIMPSMFLSLFVVLVNIIFLLYGLSSPYSFLMVRIVKTTMSAILWSFWNFYLILYFLGLLTTVTEWKQIACNPVKKIFYTFTFPIFIFTYIPISIVALFKKVEWKPITHNIVKTVEEIQ